MLWSPYCPPNHPFDPGQGGLGAVAERHPYPSTHSSEHLVRCTEPLLRCRFLGGVLAVNGSYLVHYIGRCLPSCEGIHRFRIAGKFTVHDPRSPLVNGPGFIPFLQCFQRLKGYCSEHTGVLCGIPPDLHHVLPIIPRDPCRFGLSARATDDSIREPI